MERPGRELVRTGVEVGGGGGEVDSEGDFGWREVMELAGEGVELDGHGLYKRAIHCYSSNFNPIPVALMETPVSPGCRRRTGHVTQVTPKYTAFGDGSCVTELANRC